jgi:putative acyl-CoA dehydrogenase
MLTSLAPDASAAALLDGAMAVTHEVSNQPPPLEGYNLFAEDRVRRFGESVGSEPMRWGEQANRNVPVLRTHDRFGHRIDEVEFHPSWHQLMDLAVTNERHALPWLDARPRKSGTG